jgi:hypothetical protein
MALSDFFKQNYIDALPELLAEDLEYDATHPVDDETRRLIDAKIAELNTDGGPDFVHMNPENYKPKAAEIFLAVLNRGIPLWGREGYTRDENDFSHSEVCLIAWSNILPLYYTGHLPQNDAMFVSTLWRSPRLAITELGRRQQLVAKMHKTMNPGPPPKSDYHFLGGKKYKKSRKHKKKKQKRSRKN